MVYVASARRPDVDNAVKRIVDALKGVVYHDDNQLTDYRSAVVSKDETPRIVDGIPHNTFARLMDGNEFLLRVRVPPVPSIFNDLTTS